MRLLVRIAALAVLACGLPGEVSAEIYRWTDAEGHVHFTQDLSQVPAELRRGAEASARKETKRADSAAPPAAPARASRSARRALQISFEKQGNTMVVYARINDRVTAPFIVDTGASDVLIPGHIAQAAGVEIDRDTPRATYQTANGLIAQPIVVLDAVQVGDVRVENLRGSVGGGMQVGLLGGTFFNNFTFQVDPGANVITLFPNAQVRAGVNEGEWRARFREVREQLAVIEAYLAEENLVDKARVASLEKRRAALATELEALEDEANLAGVPQAWRE